MSEDPRVTTKPQKRRGPMARLRVLGRGLSDDVPAPSREVARERIRRRPGFYASLSPEARAVLESCDGPDALGPRRID
jgi:hypothetical protein